MSSFQYLGIFRPQNSESESQRSYAHAALDDKTEKEKACAYLLCASASGLLWMKKILNIEKTTSGVLSVLLLIYALAILGGMEEGTTDCICHMLIFVNTHK